MHQTCKAFPEQYDAITPDGRVIGYLRLRWGIFSVRCPNCEGEEVFCDSKVNGHGYFFDNVARKQSLQKAKEVIAAWQNQQIL